MKVFYVSFGWGTHDRTWMATLSETEFQAMSISLSDTKLSGPDLTVPTVSSLENFLRTTAVGDSIILAGPLPTLTHALSPSGLPLVGLSWGWDLDQGISGVFFPFMGKEWTRQLRGFIVDTIQGRDLLRASGVTHDRILATAWPIDCSLFTDRGPSLASGPLPVPKDATLLLSLRAHTPIHGIADILNAFHLAKNVRSELFLVIGGSGPQTGLFQQLSRDLGVSDSILWLGSLDEEKLPELIRSVDKCVIASSTDGTPVSMLQSLACGVEVITPDRANYVAWQKSPSTNTYKDKNIYDLARVMTTVGRKQRADREVTVTPSMLEQMSIPHVGGKLQEFLRSIKTI